MKRGTTPTLPIKIKIPFDNVKQVEFIFKKNMSDQANILLYKIFDKDIPVQEKDMNSFVVNLKLDANETMRLSVGEVYMDTRVILTDGTIPETKIIKININETLFREVYQSD